MKHRFDVLDIFRGLFASMVVLFHMAFFTDTPLINNRLVQNADMFVDFFFVLSGFVIAYSYPQFETSRKLQRFLTRRFWRIYPLHFVMLLAVLFVELTKNSLSDYVHINQPDNPNNNVYTFLTSLLLLNSVKLFGVTDVSWNIPSWSISAEMIAYVVYGLAMRLIAPRWKAPAFLALSVGAAATLVAVTGKMELNYSFDYGFLRGLTGFFAGAFCFTLFSAAYDRVRALPGGLFSLLEVLMLALIVVSISFGEALKHIGLLYEFVFLAAIFVFSFEKGICSSTLKKSTLLHRVGTYSYSIYLTHPLTLSLFNILFVRILKFSPASYSYLVFLNFVVIYFVARWTYHHIELKFKDGRLPFLSQRV